MLQGATRAGGDPADAWRVGPSAVPKEGRRVVRAAADHLRHVRRHVQPSRRLSEARAWLRALGWSSPQLCHLPVLAVAHHPNEGRVSRGPCLRQREHGRRLLRLLRSGRSGPHRKRESPCALAAVSRRTATRSALGRSEGPRVPTLRWRARRGHEPHARTPLPCVRQGYDSAPGPARARAAPVRASNGVRGHLRPRGRSRTTVSLRR
jgi:hypothetical protein